MKKSALSMFFLLLSGICFAQTYTAQGYGVCQNSDPTSKPLVCEVKLSQNGVLQGYLSFVLNQDGTGKAWTYDATDTQTGYFTDVNGTIDTANYMLHFTFNGGRDKADLGYAIAPGGCRPYCHPPHVYITGGIVEEK